MPVNSAERWRRLDALFITASDLPPGAREAFIEREATGDATLGLELREMLACAAGAESAIGSAVRSAAQQALGASNWIGRGTGDMIGPYRIVREIGRGGMGIVFEAVRDDEAYHKTVAIKVGRELDERFRSERQILAGLEHPHIARFLDGGSDRGVPYLVMEYVEGRPITAWCEEQRLGLRERIELFRQVCAAVHYAHENMIVHRDLKPSNILVGRNGEAKLLDFGIARLMAAEGHITAGLPMWTPDYTSPEQVRGGHATGRTDVYSLGLILYELLCGMRAQTADTSSPLALDQSICEAEPPPASVTAVRAGDRALSRELRGDLDTIVAMAIRKEPQRRYSSAGALSADLGRYLENRPVEARPGTSAYRLLKFVRRQRLATGVMVLLIASIAAGVVSTIHQARRAEHRFEQVRGLANAFIFDVHDRIQDLPGATEARRAIVSTALRYLESIRQEAGADAALQLELAAAYQRIGDVQGLPSRSNLGDTRGAMASYRRAEELLTPLDRGGDIRASYLLASVIRGIAAVRTATNQGAEAMKDLERAREISLRIVAAQPKDTRALTLAADIDGSLTRLARELRDSGRAVQAAEEAMQMAQRLVALDPSSLQSRDYLAEAQSALGTAYRQTGELERSAESFRVSVALREQLVREQPGRVSFRRNLMMSYGHLGDALGLPRSRGLGDLEGAADAFRNAAGIAAWLGRSDPADRKARSDLANADFRLGSVLLPQKGRAPEALSVFEQAESILSDLRRQDPANTNYRYNYLYAMRKKGEALEALGHTAEASRNLTAVISMSGTLRGGHLEQEGKNGARAATVELAKIKASAGDPGAVELADRALAGLAGSAPGEDAWAWAVMYADLGGVYRRTGRREAAASCLEKSAKLWREMKLPAALENERQKELAVVQKQAANLAHR